MSLIPGAVGTATTFTDGLQGAFSASGAITPAGGIVGSNGTAAAAAGHIGEVIASGVTTSSPVSLAVSGTVYNITSISLTAGDWFIWAGVAYNFSSTSAAITVLQAGTHTTSATIGGDNYVNPNGLIQRVAQGFPNAYLLGANFGIYTLVLNPLRARVTSTTTLYLVASANWTTGTADGSGSITATRVR